MMGSSYRIITTAGSKTIRQMFQALLRSNAIRSGCKIPYAKQYTSDEKGRTVTTNIQILTLVVGPTWDKSGKQILDNVLKDWKEFEDL